MLLQRIIHNLKWKVEQIRVFNIFIFQQTKFDDTLKDLNPHSESICDEVNLHEK